MSDLRVLIVVDGAVLGGAERLLLDVATRLDPELIDVRVATAEPGPLVTALAAAGIDVLSPARSLTPDDLRQPVRDADVVIGWADHAHLLVGPMAADAGRPAIWWRTRTWRDRPYEWEASHVPADVAVCPTAAGAAGMARALPSHQIEVINPGIDVGAVAAGLSEGHAIRERLGWTDAVIVGMVARLDPAKGQDTLVEAARKMIAVDDRVRVLIVGSDIVGYDEDVEGELRRLVAGEGLVDHVRFVAQVDDPIPYQAALDISVNASTHEAFGLSMLESLALGIPVVATATDGGRELIESGVTGSLVPIGDVDALADAMLAIAADDPQRQAMSARARVRATQYDISSTVRATEDLLHRVASNAALSSAVGARTSPQP